MLVCNKKMRRQYARKRQRNIDLRMAHLHKNTCVLVMAHAGWLARLTRRRGECGSSSARRRRRRLRRCCCCCFEAVRATRARAQTKLVLWQHGYCAQHIAADNTLIVQSLEFARTTLACVRACACVWLHCGRARAQSSLSARIVMGHARAIASSAAHSATTTAATLSRRPILRRPRARIASFIATLIRPIFSLALTNTFSRASPHLAYEYSRTKRSNNNRVRAVQAK